MIAVGKISKSIGLKGEVRVTLLTDSPGRFRTLKSVWIGSEEGTAMRFKIQSVRVSPAAVVMQVEKVQTRTAADALRGQFVFVADKDQVKPKKGSYFIHEIVGMMVEDGELDEDIFRLFVDSGVYLTYANKYLTRNQIDTVDLNTLPGYAKKKVPRKKAA